MFCNMFLIIWISFSVFSNGYVCILFEKYLTAVDFWSTEWQESLYNDAIRYCGLCYRNYIMAYNFHQISGKENLWKTPHQAKYNTQIREELYYKLLLQLKKT